jgi:hypothetical protein
VTAVKTFIDTVTRVYSYYSNNAPAIHLIIDIVTRNYSRFSNNVTAVKHIMDTEPKVSSAFLIKKLQISSL